MIEPIAQTRLVGLLVAVVSAATLEVYLSHFYVVEFDPVRALPFPLNVLAFAACAFLLAVAFHRISRPIQDRLRRLSEARKVHG